MSRQAKLARKRIHIVTCRRVASRGYRYQWTCLITRRGALVADADASTEQDAVTMAVAMYRANHWHHR